ncbi:MAG: trimethylamine methyltransferase family protein [Promethearchaeota archaeon]
MMIMNQIEVLTKDEIELIHQNTIELLETIGVRVESIEARNLLIENGAEFDNNSKYVKFPENLVKETIKIVPDSFSLWGPDGSFKFDVNTSSTKFATVGTPVKMYDPEKKSGVRKSLLEDTISQIRIVDSLKNIVCSHLDVWPNDVPYTETHYHSIRAWAEHSFKPFGLGCYGRVASKDMMVMASIIAGGEDELKKRPRLIGFFNPTSPLMLTKIMLNGLFVFANYKQPIIIASAASAGATAPVTLAGLLIQTNMEVLSSIVLTELINPGTPVFYSTMNCPMDPPSGNVAWGSIETGLITAATAQLARFYNIPSRGPGAVTESKCFDIQNGFERFMTLFFAVQAGINYITCAGTYESSLAEALELLVIDDELIDMINHGMKGIRFNEETLAINEIKRVANEGKNYMMLKHTSKNTRKEIFVPKLADRDKRGVWRRNGSKDIIVRAKEKVNLILENQVGPGITPEVDKKLKEYFKIIASRTMDEFRKAEGLDESDDPQEIIGLEG